MALPSAVRKAGEEADRQAAAAGMSNVPGAAPAQAPTPEPVEPRATDPQPANPEPDKGQNHDWEARFRNYKASTDATIAELRQQINSQQQLVTDLQRQNKELMDELRAKPTTQEPTADEKKEAAFQAWLKRVPQKFKDEYDEDWLRDQFDLQQALYPQGGGTDPDLVKRLEAAENRLQQQEQTQQKTARDLYLDELDDQFPKGEWESLTNPTEPAEKAAWGKFCGTRVSPVDTRTYGEILSSADARSDASAVIWVLTQYKTQQGNPPPTPADPREQLVTPAGGAPNGSPVDERNSRVKAYTQSEINEFYTDVTKGKYRHNPEEAQRIEREILEAQSAGRILPG